LAEKPNVITRSCNNILANEKGFVKFSGIIPLR
jgi:hypothetical protein